MMYNMKKVKKINVRNATNVTLLKTISSSVNSHKEPKNLSYVYERKQSTFISVHNLPPGAAWCGVLIGHKTSSASDKAI